MKEIEKAWLGDRTNCPNSNTQASSGSLTLDCFWGLFLIAGIASLLALMISVSMFLYKEREQILIWFDSESSIWRRICHTLIIFDRKDLSSHIFRNRAPQEESYSDSVPSLGASHASTNTNCPPSPSSCSVHVEPHFTFLGDSRTPSIEYCHPNLHGQEFLLAQAIEQIGHPNQDGPRTAENSS